MDGNDKDAGIKFLGPPVDEHGRIMKREFRCETALSLASLTDEYAFFTPALMYLYGAFYDGPLIDFMHEIREQVPLYYRRFRRPLFRGLETADGNTDWNHALWVVRREHYQRLSDFIMTLTFMFREEERIICFGEQDLTIFDPLAADRCTVWRENMPTLSVRAFGINSNTFRAAFIIPLRGVIQRNVMDTPKVQFLAGDPLMSIYAKASIDGRNPVDARNAILFTKKVNAMLQSRVNS